jgi:tRNA pseudouridine38-40 synthase
MRYFFEIAYDGARYAGWQNQANAIGVQAVVEESLSKLLRTSVSITGSGRTDTGVHCRQQFFHVDIETPVDTQALQWKLNSFLPKDIAIHGIRAVTPDAHARFSAFDRSYEYWLTTVKDPFLQGRALHYFKPLDWQTMNRSASLLLGEHDFACFSKVKTDVSNFFCTIKRAEWVQADDKMIFHITANRFLRGMVRAIVGTLLEVGERKISEADFQQILESKDRTRAGANVAPEGLYLVEVNYPSIIFI